MQRMYKRLVYTCDFCAIFVAVLNYMCRSGDFHSGVKYRKCLKLDASFNDYSGNVQPFRAETARKSQLGLQTRLNMRMRLKGASYARKKKCSATVVASTTVKIPVR